MATVDPGGRFESNEQRRVAGNCGTPRTLDDLHRALSLDPHTPALGPSDRAEVERIANQLVDDGILSDSGGKYHLLKAGTELLCAGHPDEAPPLDEAQAERLGVEHDERESKLIADEREKALAVLEAAYDQSRRQIDAQVAGPIALDEES